MSRLLLSGNEAIALGAYEAGVTVGTGYPGTPSTEILESLTTYPGVYTEWSINEKVAYEVGLGAALSGARTLVTMKHVGLNVAADPLFTSAYVGVKGGLVVVSADDPNMHSSQNEQDNRHYAVSAKIPMLEPADSQEARDFTIEAFRLSEQYDTPVLLRPTTRISHSKSIVRSDRQRERHTAAGFERNQKKYVMIPAFARLRHPVIEKRLHDLSQHAETLEINRMELRDTDMGFVTSGISYTYVREAFPDASVLKLGLVHPLPLALLREFFDAIKKVVVVEELDPFLENRIRSFGIAAEGKKYLPVTGEFDPSLLKRAFRSATESTASPPIPITDIVLPPRPPQLCPGCPHRTVFQVLKRLHAIVSGDIGCYTLGVLPPFQSIDTCVEMGGSIGLAQGIEIVEPEQASRPIVSVIGDSTFAHSGITGLFNAAYNRRRTLIIVLDNGTTAMTGMQPNPFSGERINGEPALQIDYGKLAESAGIGDANFRIADAYRPEEIEQAVTSMLSTRKLSLLVVKGTCVILKRRRRRK